LESDEEEKEIMRNKHKLKGVRIFIENDLSWEERNIQVKINSWVKEQRRKELEVKVEIGRIRVKGLWKTWADVEKEKLMGERKEDENRKGEEEGEEGDDGRKKEEGGDKNFV